MTAGRPLKYDPRTFEELAHVYLLGAKERKNKPTKAGLLYALDISRETYREYKERPEFVDIIRKAELEIEDAWVQRLDKAQATGAIFYLKNAFREHYRDAYEQDVTSGGDKLTIAPIMYATQDTPPIQSPSVPTESPESAG